MSIQAVLFWLPGTCGQSGLTHFQLVLWKNSRERLAKMVLRFPMCESKSGLLGKALEGRSQGNPTCFPKIGRLSAHIGICELYLSVASPAGCTGMVAGFYHPPQYFQIDGFFTFSVLSSS